MMQGRKACQQACVIIHFTPIINVITQGTLERAEKPSYFPFISPSITYICYYQKGFLLAVEPNISKILQRLFFCKFSEDMFSNIEMAAASLHPFEDPLSPSDTREQFESHGTSKYAIKSFFNYDTMRVMQLRL